MTRRGFSLIETMVVLGISVAALIALVNLFLMFNSIYGYQQAFIASAGSAGTTMNALEAAILPANQVLVSHSFSGDTYTSSETILVLELPSIDSSGALIAGAKDYVAFYTSGASFFRRTEAAAGSVRISGVKTLSSAVASISFSYDDADFAKVTNITTDLQMQAALKQQTVQSHLSGRWYLRNRQPSP